tara:strand:+ start:105 stop:266 length:162 start_codon:yes stop_codon:yes gene_type:complete
MAEATEFLITNWEYVAIGILVLDKVVALSPTKWDDLLWTSVKKSIMKLSGKGK